MESSWNTTQIAHNFKCSWDIKTPIPKVSNKKCATMNGKWMNQPDWTSVVDDRSGGCAAKRQIGSANTWNQKC